MLSGGLSPSEGTWSAAVLRGDFSADCLVSVPGGQCSQRIGELHHWHFCNPCIAVDLAVQFKLESGIRTWTLIWVYVQLGTSGSYCTKLAKDQHSPAELEPWLMPNFYLPLIHTIIDLWVIDYVSSPVW